MAGTGVGVKAGAEIGALVKALVERATDSYVTYDGLKHMIDGAYYSAAMKAREEGTSLTRFASVIDRTRAWIWSVGNRRASAPGPSIAFVEAAETHDRARMLATLLQRKPEGMRMGDLLNTFVTDFGPITLAQFTEAMAFLAAKSATVQAGDHVVGCPHTDWTGRTTRASMASKVATVARIAEDTLARPTPDRMVMRIAFRARSTADAARMFAEIDDDITRRAKNAEEACGEEGVLYEIVFGAGPY